MTCGTYLYVSYIDVAEHLHITCIQGLSQGGATGANAPATLRGGGLLLAYVESP